MVIPKALRERAGLAPGTPIDFAFHNGTIEITPVHDAIEWEQVGRVRFPVLRGPGLTGEEISDLIERGREERMAQVLHAGR